MLPAIIVGIVFSVPLSAIVGAYWVKVKRLELESGGPAREIDARLRALEAENRELRSRVEVLETIATSDTPSSARTRVRVAASAAEVLAESAHEHEVPAARAARRSD